MRRFEAGGVDRRQMIFLNFEDDRLLPIKSRELDLILSTHAELYPEFADRRKFFFFDEIQNAPRWESFVRRLHDTQDAQIFLTGSSSHLLVGEYPAPELETARRILLGAARRLHHAIQAHHHPSNDLSHDRLLQSSALLIPRTPGVLRPDVFS